MKKSIRSESEFKRLKKAGEQHIQYEIHIHLCFMPQQLTFLMIYIQHESIVLYNQVVRYLITEKTTQGLEATLQVLNIHQWRNGPIRVIDTESLANDAALIYIGCLEGLEARRTAVRQGKDFPGNYVSRMANLVFGVGSARAMNGRLMGAARRLFGRWLVVNDRRQEDFNDGNDDAILNGPNPNRIPYVAPRHAANHGQVAQGVAGLHDCSVQPCQPAINPHGRLHKNEQAKGKLFRIRKFPVHK